MCLCRHLQSSAHPAVLCVLLTCPAGTLGTLAGGSLLDAIGSSMRNALLLCAAGVGAGACLAVAAFWAAGIFGLFALVFAAAQLAMFASAVS